MYQTPEQCGISSRQILKYLQDLDRAGLSTKSMILSVGDRIFLSANWAPFHESYQHRMYSSSKSFVSLAIGFCVQEGLLDLEDPIGKFFPEHGEKALRHTATLRQMLKMHSALHKSTGWFTAGYSDRTAHYFDKTPEKFPDSIYSYDSAGSFLLCAVVERVTGMPFLSYLKEKVLREIGFSEESFCLTCPGGHSWGDSGILCTTHDLWLFARFVLNGGTWKGKRYLQEEYLREALRCEDVVSPFGFTGASKCGYGYQFWGYPEGCFGTSGMGCQFCLCDPRHDFIFVITSNNQGNPEGASQIFDPLYRHVIHHLGSPLPEDPEGFAELQNYLAGLKLFSLPGEKRSPFAEKIRDKVFLCEENPTGIRQFSLSFTETEGILSYENDQGEKQLRFGFGHNVFEKFPQWGYSREMGGVSTPDHRYEAACSADWPTPRLLRIRVQIIDQYLGNLAIRFGFSDEDHVTVEMQKAAEDFLKEYSGLFSAVAGKEP